MRTDRLTGMLGLAKRARRLIAGTLPVEKELAAGRAQLVLADEALSPGSMEKLENACRKAGAELKKLPEGMLSQALGEPRMCACITDAGFTKQILMLMN